MLRKLAFPFIVLAGVFFILFSVPSVNAFDLFNHCNNTPKPTGCAASNPCPAGSTNSTCSDALNKGTTNPIAGSNGILQEAANLVALITGIAAVIVIIISGFIFVTAGGTGFKAAAGGAPTKAAKARSTLAGAVIGLFIVAISWALVSFIISHFVNS